MSVKPIVNGLVVKADADMLHAGGGLLIKTASAPSTPSTGQVVFYVKTDKFTYIKDDAGTETGCAG